MVKDSHNNLDNPTDREWIKQQLKQIKKEKKAGNERRAQRLADELFNFVDWE